MLPSAAWHALEAIPGQAAVASVWRAHLGEAFEGFCSAVLQEAPEPAGCYPCRRCGCAHEVIRLAPDRAIAQCVCAAPGCPDLPLTSAELRLWTLSWPRLGRALCQALELEFKPAGVQLWNTRQVGAWSSDAVPVVLTVQSARPDFRFVVAQLVARLRQRFILLAPTNRWLDVTSQELLASVGAGCFDLATQLRLLRSGQLEAVQAPGELFRQFQPQPRLPLAEQQARQLLELLRRLEAEAPSKPPSLLRVLHRYAVGQRSTAKIAEECGCSKTTVVDRLRRIRDQSGQSPKELRRLGAELGALYELREEPRARRLRRRQLME